jgi:hypothetical protein
LQQLLATTAADLTKAATASFAKDNFGEVVFVVKNMVYANCLEDFLEQFSNTNLKKLLHSFKELVSIDDAKPPLPLEYSEDLRGRIEEVKVRSKDFLKSVEGVLVPLYYVNSALFHIEDVGKNTKDLCRRIFGIVLRKVHLIFRENVKRNLTGDKAASRQGFVLARDVFVTLERDIQALLQSLVTIRPEPDILSEELLALFDVPSRTVYKLGEEVYRKKLAEFFGHFGGVVAKCLQTLEGGQSYNIDAEKQSLNVYFWVAKAAKFPKRDWLEGVVKAFEGVWAQVHALIGKIYSENKEKQLVKKMTNVCWNFYALISWIETWSFEYTLGRESEPTLTTPELETFVRQFAVNKEFLSRKIFENLWAHMASLAPDRKTSFLGFFVESDRRKQFLDVGWNISNRKPEENRMLLAGKLMKKHQPLVKELWGVDAGREGLFKFLGTHGLGHLQPFLEA